MKCTAVLRLLPVLLPLLKAAARNPKVRELPHLKPGSNRLFGGGVR